MVIYEMGDVQAITQIDYKYVFLSVIAILIGLKVIISLGEWFCVKFGLETKWIRRKREERELLKKTAESLAELQTRHDNDKKECLKHDDEIRADLKNLTALFIDKEINDYRWEIINFSTKVAERKPCNKDSYKHCLRTYEKYERLLEQEGLENGEVEISMDIIRESYAEKLKNGF